MKVGEAILPSKGVGLQQATDSIRYKNGRRNPDFHRLTDEAAAEVATVRLHLGPSRFTPKQLPGVTQAALGRSNPRAGLLIR